VLWVWCRLEYVGAEWHFVGVYVVLVGELLLYSVYVYAGGQGGLAQYVWCISI